MTSMRARAFLWLLRNRHLLRFGRRSEVPDWEHDLEAVRDSAARGSALFGKVPKGVQSVPAGLKGVDAEWIQPEGGAGRETILYFRGGGYVLGSIEAHRGIVAKFVRGTGLRALLFEYALAPEHPYPAALDDALRAYHALLLAGVAAEEIVFAGDSAGGGLCLATMLALKDQGAPLPAGAAVLSPWTDVACSGESLMTNAHRCLAPVNSWQACRKHYAGGNDPFHPYISPLYGDLAGLPPLFISVGSHETLLSDSIRFADRARQAGVSVELNVGEKMCHCYPACAPLFPEATRALEEICGWLHGRVHLA